MTKEEKMKDKVVHNSGATTGATFRFDLIPIEALIRLANRYELGEVKHGHNNWRKGLGDKDYVLNRINHIINHALRLKEKLDGQVLLDSDDDIGAIAWGAAFLSVALPNYPNDTKLGK